MNTAETQFRRVALEAVTENGELLIDMPKVNDLYSIIVVLAGTVTVGTEAATAAPAHSPSELIRRVDLIANGKDVLEQTLFRMAAFGNYHRRFQSEVVVPGLTVAAHPFRAVGFFDRINVDGPRPKDSALQAYLTNLLQLRIQFGAATDILTPDGSTSLTLSNTTVEILTESRNEIGGDRGEAKVIKKRTLQTVPVTGANSNLRVPIPHSNSIRTLTALATDAGEPSDALINSMEFSVNGIDVRHQAGYLATRSSNRAKVQAAVPAGFAVIDASPEGKMAEFYNLKAAANVTLAELVFDVNAPGGAGQIDIAIEEFVGL